MRFQHNFADRRPIALQKCFAQIDRRVADAFKNIENFLVAVNMAFGHFPIIRPGIARLAGVADDDSFLQSFDVNVQSLTLNAFGTEMNGSRAAELRRIVILKAGWNFDHLTFDVGGNRDKSFGRVTIADQSI